MVNKRDSNIELLRVIAMLSIVGHHFVVNSGVWSLMDREIFDPSAKMFWMQVLGMWGKTAINVFVLITGYFMCTGSLTKRRFFKVFLQLEFYFIAMYAIMASFGKVPISIAAILNLVIWPMTKINENFETGFIWFYLFIPFYNLLIRAATRRQLYSLCGVLLAMFSISATFFMNTTVYHYVGWYATLYFVGALIRLYPMKWMLDCKCSFWVLVLCYSSAILSVVCYDMSMKLFHFGGRLGAHYFVADSNKALAFACGVSAFVFFKNLRLGHNALINGVAKITFGVFLIHSATGMRDYLWKDLVDVCGHYVSLSFCGLVFFSVAVCIAVFVICSILDWFRIVLIERPLFKRLFPLKR